MASLITQLSRLVIQNSRSIYTCSSLNAARKGTRARKEALRKSRTKEVIKKRFIPHTQRLILALVCVLA